MKKLAVILLILIVIAAGVVLCVFLKKEPATPPPPRHDPPPNTEQINEVLSGSLALVEAQHTFYTHVKLSERFAGSVSELRFHKDQGTVMVHDVWHASDAVPEPVPVQGYLYSSKLMSRDEGEKDGFVISAFPAEERHDQQDGWPVFLSIVPNSDGGIIGMSFRETWEIADPEAAAAIRALFTGDKVSWAELETWSPEYFEGSTKIENFQKKEQSLPSSP